MKPHSVMFINRVYPPVDGATGQLLAELARELTGAGWRVTVMTSRPSPFWPRSERVLEVQVERVRGLSFTRTNHWRRALSYLSLYPGLLQRALRLPSADVVVTLTDPPLQLLLGPVLKRARHTRLVHWAQDLYPEVAEELGVLRRGGAIARGCRALSNWGLSQHDAVVAVGRCMRQRLIERGVPERAIRVIPNWAPAAPGSSSELASETFRRARAWQEKFVVMYSGNLGLAHPLEAVLDAAEQLRAGHPEILFAFVGHGARLSWVQEQVRKRGLTNVQFLPPQPSEKLAGSLGAADVHLASMAENLCGLVVPSKVYGALGAGRPCLFLGPAASEAARIIQQHRGGDVIPGATGQTVASCLVQWAADRPRREAASRRLLLASSAFGVIPAAASFEGMLHELVAGMPSRLAAPAPTLLPARAPADSQ